MNNDLFPFRFLKDGECLGAVGRNFSEPGLLLLRQVASVRNGIKGTIRLLDRDQMVGSVVGVGNPVGIRNMREGWRVRVGERFSDFALIRDGGTG